MPAFGINLTRNGSQVFRIPLEPGEVENLTEFFKYFLQSLYEHRHLEESKRLQEYKSKSEDTTVSEEAPF